MRIAAACLVVVLTCSCHETVGNPTPEATAELGSKLLGLLDLESFSLTEENLRFKYRVTNVFPHAIWVCVNIGQLLNQDSRFSVETEIHEGTLQIRRRGNLKQEAVVEDSQARAVYQRLQPGTSRSGIVVLPLPVIDWSLVRVTGSPVKPVVLSQVVFELGYFDIDLLSDLLPAIDPVQSYEAYRYGFRQGPDTAFISYVEPRRWNWLDWERCARITIPDVSVPGRIP